MRPVTHRSTGADPGLAVRAEHLRELMDDPACDPTRLQATYRRFGTVNRLVSGWGTVYRTHLRPYLRCLGRPARVLDLGSGGGDVLVRLARLAERDGLGVRWLGADPDPRATAASRALTAPASVAFAQTDAQTLVADGERFDAVISNHVLHHLRDAQLKEFVSASSTLSAGPVLHSDIARSRPAYALYAVGITPLEHGTFLRTDGLRSIRRSFRPGELARLLDDDWRVDSPVPFRLLARRVPRG